MHMYSLHHLQLDLDPMLTYTTRNRLTSAMVRKRTYVGDDDPKLVETIERDIISQDVPLTPAPPCDLL